MKGGYVIIDLKNRPFTTAVGVVVDGIYDRLEATRKPVRLSNVVIDSVELRDIDVSNIGVSGSSFIGSITFADKTYSLEITDVDVIKFTLES